MNVIQVCDFFRAKDHEVGSYETEQIVDVPGAEDMQNESKLQYASYHAHTS